MNLVDAIETIASGRDHYNKDPQYHQAQAAARAGKLGLWATANPQDTWAYHRTKKAKR